MNRFLALLLSLVLTLTLCACGGGEDTAHVGQYDCTSVTMGDVVIDTIEGSLDLQKGGKGTLTLGHDEDEDAATVPEEELTDEEKRVKRMAEEYDELAGRLHRLQAFRDTDTYKQLPENSRYLLDKQCKAMDDYESTLKQRIQLECDKANDKKDE